MSGERLRQSGKDDAALLHPGNYLKKEDLRGKTVTVTIEDIDPDHVLNTADGSQEMKPALHFVESEKILILNKGNTQALVDLYGANMTNWIGKKIAIWNNPDVEFAGRRVGGIRIKSAPPQQRNGRRVDADEEEQYYKETLQDMDNDAPPF
jgi:hypothetical protein